MQFDLGEASYDKYEFTAAAPRDPVCVGGRFDEIH